MRFFRLFVGLYTAALVACAQVPQEARPELFWPMPPERPRIQLVDIVMGSIDVIGSRGGKVKQTLFGEEGEIRLAKPSYIAVNDGVVYVTDINRVQVYDFKKKKFSLLGLGPIRNATGIGVTSKGVLYVSDSALQRVLIIDPKDIQAKIIGGEDTLSSPGGIAIDEPRNRFFVADAKKHAVLAFSLSGEYLFTIGQRGAMQGTFNFPYDVKVDSEGYIYVVDTGNFRIQIFDTEGKFVHTFGSIGTAPGQFARPKGIAVDSDGYIYVVDSAFGNFQIFDAEGNVYLDIGSCGSETGMFLLPMGIAVDENNRIYIVDQINRRIQVFQALKYQDEKDIKVKRPKDLLLFR